MIARLIGKSADGTAGYFEFIEMPNLELDGMYEIKHIPQRDELFYSKRALFNILCRDWAKHQRETNGNQVNEEAVKLHFKFLGGCAEMVDTPAGKVLIGDSFANAGEKGLDDVIRTYNAGLAYCESVDVNFYIWFMNKYDTKREEKLNAIR